MIYKSNKHPEHISEIDINKKILAITGHLSTGGSPQYLYEYLKTVKEIYSEIKVIEFSNFSNDYIIQKNRIQNLIGVNNIICLGDINVSQDMWYNDKMKLISIIEDYKPDIIWMNEFPENYEYRSPPNDLMEYIYRDERSYKIIETTHYNAVNFDDKIYIGDEFMFCSPSHIEKSKKIDIKKYVWEVPLNLIERPDRDSTLQSLGIDPNYIHVLNVGLFHKNKNQKYIFELANTLKDHPIMFHFIGNDCFFDECGMTEDELRLDNYRIWGERSDVDKFMSCIDIYLFPSIKELNPLTVKEALSNQMDVLVNRDEYVSQYKDYENFYIIDEVNVIEHIKNKIQNKNSGEY